MDNQENNYERLSAEIENLKAQNELLSEKLNKPSGFKVFLAIVVMVLLSLVYCFLAYWVAFLCTKLLGWLLGFGTGGIVAAVIIFTGSAFTVLYLAMVLSGSVTIMAANAIAPSPNGTRYLVFGVLGTIYYLCSLFVLVFLAEGSVMLPIIQTIFLIGYFASMIFLRNRAYKTS